MPHVINTNPEDRICALFRCGQEADAIRLMDAHGGPLYPFHRGYESLGRILQVLPEGLWRRSETVLGALLFYLVKHGRAARARTHLDEVRDVYGHLPVFTFHELAVALHLGTPIGEESLAAWRDLERKLPVTDPLFEGIYHNAMLVILVRLQRLAEAKIAGRRAIEGYRHAGHLYLEHFIHVHLADLNLIEGRLTAARRSLVAAERCLDAANQLHANEHDIIRIVRLGLDYETGKIEHIPAEALRLCTSLVNGDSWAELFVQLARISVLSTYFLSGREPALAMLEQFHIGYARRHGGYNPGMQLLNGFIDRLDGQLGEADRCMADVLQQPLQSAIGNVMMHELSLALGMEPDMALPVTGPRLDVLGALNAARSNTGATRSRMVERALWLAVDEGLMGPFLENRDVLARAGSRLTHGRFARGHRQLARMAKRVMEKVERSYVVPEPLSGLGVRPRQYRVLLALQSGLTNKQIARLLGITEAGVKYHLALLFKLTKTKRRGELIELISNL